jgi:hypothetical protein
MTTTQRRGYAETPQASRYLQQLCKHWGHRFDASFDERRGTVDFKDGSSVEIEADDERLCLVIHGPEASLDMLEAVVVEHLDRFAHREGKLAYHWER